MQRVIILEADNSISSDLGDAVGQSLPAWDISLAATASHAVAYMFDREIPTHFVVVHPSPDDPDVNTAIEVAILAEVPIILIEDAQVFRPILGPHTISVRIEQPFTTGVVTKAIATALSDAIEKVENSAAG